MKVIFLPMIWIPLLLSTFTPCEAWQKKAQNHRQSTTDIYRSEDEPTLTSLMDILNYHIKTPDNLSQKNIIVAGVTILSGLVMYIGAERVLALPVVGNILKTITNTFVTPQDLIQGLGLVVGIFGSLGLYSNGSDLRKKFMGSFASVLLAKQVSAPGKVEAGEVWTSALQAFALSNLLTTAGDLVAPVIEKGMKRALRSINKEQITVADQYAY